MTAVSLTSIVVSILIFGGIIVVVTFFSGRVFWSSFKASDLLGLDPNWADLLFAHATAIAVRSFPWIVLLAFVAAIFFYISDRHLLASFVAWLPLVNFVVPPILFVTKIIASR